MFECLSCASVLILYPMSLSIFRDFSTYWPLLIVAMSSASGLPLSVIVSEAGGGSWASSNYLYRFVWTVKRSFLSCSAHHAVPGRAALALWIGGLDHRDFIEGGSLGALSGDERMMDRILLSVRSGWTPREVLSWIFPSFGGMLFDLVIDESGAA